jgi:hypothetical protein
MATQVDAVAEDVSAALDNLAPGASDAWLTASRDGSQLLLETGRWDPECVGWACLAVVSADLASGRVVRAAGALAHSDGLGAISATGRIVYPSSGGPHTLDLWRIDPAGADWSAATPLTTSSPYAFNSQPALSPDETKVAFACGDQPYGGAGTALCEVGLDGKSLRIVLGPVGAQPEFAGAQALAHPTYAADGSFVFSADRIDTQVWRLGPGETTPVLVTSVFRNDNSPCALPNGTIATLWLSEAASASGYQLKIMLPSDHSFFTRPAADVDGDAIGCSS